MNNHMEAEMNKSEEMKRYERIHYHEDKGLDSYIKKLLIGSAVVTIGALALILFY